MSEVWEAWDERLRRKVALKFLSTDGLRDPDLAARFKGESAALAKLSHPHVVLLYGNGKHEGTDFLALEYIEGLPLDHFLMSHPCGLTDTLTLLTQMASGLAAAHQAGIIHRDLKPGNIMIDTRLNAKLVDFGLAQENTGTRSSADYLIGSVNYIAPEVAAGRAPTHKSDIYALGLVLYYMLTGEVPFMGRSHEDTLEKIRSSSLAFSPRLQALLPEKLKHIVSKMTAKAPGARYDRTVDVLADLGVVDLSRWPADLREPADIRIPLANFSDLRKKCEAEGYDTSEQRFILNLAARMQLGSKATLPEDATVATRRVRLLKIQDRTLQDAIRRFQAAKSVLTGKRIELAPPEILTMPHTRKRQISKSSAAVFLILSAVVAAAFFIILSGNHDREPAQVSPSSHIDP